MFLILIVSGTTTAADLAHESDGPDTADLQTGSPANAPLFTLVFDDGNDTDYTWGLKIAAEEKAVACSAIVSDWIGRTGYMTGEQILALKAAGWEIMSHTATHPNLRRLSSKQIIDELTRSKKALVALGIDVKNLVYPYNKSNPLVRAIASNLYRSGRGGANLYDNIDTNQFLLTSFAEHKDLQIAISAIDQACKLGLWYVLYHHRINQMVRISKRFGDFKPGERLVFSPSGAIGTFVPSFWNRLGDSLWFTPIHGQAQVGDTVSTDSGDAGASVIDSGFDEREYLRKLLHYIKTAHPEMKIVTIDQGLDIMDSRKHR